MTAICDRSIKAWVEEFLLWLEANKKLCIKQEDCSVQGRVIDTVNSPKCRLSEPLKQNINVGVPGDNERVAATTSPTNECNSTP